MCLVTPESLAKDWQTSEALSRRKAGATFTLLDAAMRRKASSRSLPTTGCHAASLIGSVEERSPYFSPWTTSLIPYLPVSWSVGLSHGGNVMVWAAFFWSSTMKIRQDQWGRPCAPDQTTNKSKLSSPSWKPLCCPWMKGSTKGMAVAGWAHGLHSLSSHTGNPMLITFMYTLWWIGCLLYLMLWTHRRISGSKTYQDLFLSSLQT